MTSIEHRPFQKVRFLLAQTLLVVTCFQTIGCSKVVKAILINRTSRNFEVNSLGDEKSFQIPAYGSGFGQSSTINGRMIFVVRDKRSGDTEDLDFSEKIVNAAEVTDGVFVLEMRDGTKGRGTDLLKSERRLGG